MLRLLAAWAVTVGVQAEVKPLITTDVITGTATLLFDVYSQFQDQAKDHVDKVMQKNNIRVLKLIEEKAGVKEELVLEKIGQVQDAVVLAFTSVHASLQPAAMKLHDHLSLQTNKAIDSFETLMPNFKGFIRRSPGDLFIFAAYVCTIVYLAVRITATILFKTLAIVSFFLCCRFCRRSSKAVSKKAAKKTAGKEATKPAPAPKASGKKK